MNLIISDSLNLPFKLATFDVLFAITLFQNLVNPKKALLEMIKVTKKGATIIISGLKKHFNEEEFISLLTSTGLKIKKFVFKDLKDYVAICINNY